MKYRLNEIMGKTTYTADKTEVINIDQADPISELIIALTVNASAAGSMTLHPTACLSKIELMDGSKPLVSLKGLQAEAIDWYTHKAFRPGNYNIALNGNSMVRYIGINFGRYLWDPQYAFDPKKYTNPQLKLTLDINGGGLTATSDTLAVFANSFDRKAISPVGFMSCIDVADKPLAASGHIYYDLPVDLALRRMFYRVQQAGLEPNQMITNLRLGENGYKTIPFDLSTEDIVAMIAAEYPEVAEEYFFATTTSNRYLMITPSSRVTAWGTPWGATAIANSLTLYDGDGGRLKTIDSTGVNAMIGVKGQHPHCMWQIPFGDLKDPTDWYEMEGLTKLQLDVTTASGAAATDIGELVVEQVVRY